MANLLDKASILLTPNAYNNESMLSVKPTNGDGDFTFSRNSAATRVNAQGLVENVQILSSDLVQNGSFSQIGAEEVTNGSFTNGSTDWTLGTGWSIGEDKAISDGSGSIPNTDLIQANVFTTSKSYKVTLEIKDYISGNLQLQNNTTNFPQSNGIHTIYSSEGGTSLILRSLSFIGSITNITVKEVGQNWTFGDGFTPDQANSKATCDGTQSAATDLTQTISTNIQNKLVRVSFTLDYTAGVLVGSLSGTGAVDFNNITSSGTYTAEMTSNEVNPPLILQGDANFIGSITNIVILEITNDTNLPRINYEGFSYQDSLGSELVTNGDFATNSYWELGSGSSISGGSLNIISAPYNAATRQALSLTSGKTYKIVINAIAVGSATSNTFQLGFGTIGGNPSSNTQYEFEEGASVKTLTVTASATDAAVLFRARDASTSNLSITNVSVKEYLGQEVVPDSSCGSWLFEQQSTNYGTNSEQPSTWHSSGGVTITANATTSPQGISNASTVVNTTTSAYARNRFIYSSSAATLDVTTSFFIKYTNNQWVYIRPMFFNGGSSLITWFDIQNGVLGTSNNVSSSIKDFGNGWYRCSITHQIAPATSTSGYVQIYACDNDNSTTQVIGQGFAAYGSQGEEQSFPTSYIPTQGATSTRLQDLATDSGNSTLINSTEGVFYVEIKANAIYNLQRWISLSDGTNNNKVVIGFLNHPSELKVAGEIRSGGVNQAFMANNFGAVAPEYVKVAVKYKENDFALWINGVEVATDTSGVTPIGLNELTFTRGDSGQTFFGKCRALAVFKEALTDAKLTLLTTI